MQELFLQASEALDQRGFQVHCADTVNDVKALLLSLIPEGASVGIGGSITLKEMDIENALTQSGHTVWWHWSASPAQRASVTAQALNADVYLASSNAVTKQGEIVNIDGTGNRVTGMYYGPKKVILVIGQQKLVDGGINAAIARIKRYACPPNAKRLGLDTPCAHTGVCNPDQCGDDCMCRVTTVLNRPSRGRDVTVILVKEAIGY